MFTYINVSKLTCCYIFTVAVAGIYCESFKFANFPILNALANVKASTHFWIHISYMYLQLWMQ